MKIQLKRSNVLEGGFAKQPTLGQMEYGELAVNYNADDSCIFIKNSANEIVRISNAGIPIPGDDAPQSGTLDDRYVMLAGSTMTGALILNADPVNALGSATKQYVDQQIVDIDIPAATDPAPNPPASPEKGQLWWNTNDGRLYIWYEDGNSNQWVPATPESSNVNVTVDGGLEVNQGGAASIKVRPDYGLSTSSDGLQIDVRPNYGLSTSSDGLQIDVRPGYGIAVSALGIQIGDDWSNIPALPEV